MLFPLNSSQKTDAIHELPMSQERMMQSAEKRIYDLSGRRMGNRGGLNKGLYIINGRKVVIP